MHFEKPTPQQLSHQQAKAAAVFCKLILAVAMAQSFVSKGGFVLPSGCRSFVRRPDVVLILPQEAHSAHFTCEHLSDGNKSRKQPNNGDKTGYQHSLQEMICSVKRSAANGMRAGKGGAAYVGLAAHLVLFQVARNQTSRRVPLRMKFGARRCALRSLTAISNLVGFSQSHCSMPVKEVDLYIERRKRHELAGVG